MGQGDAASELAEVAALVDEQRWSDALKRLGPLRRSAEDDPEVWHWQALALRGAGELVEASSAAERWSALAPTSVGAMRLKVEILADRRKHYAAAELAEELIALRPDDAELHALLAEQLRAAGLVPRARVAVDRAIELEPRNWRHHQLAGTIELAGGQAGRAASHFREALRLDPDNGQLAVQLKRASEAESDRRAVVKTTARRSKSDSKARARQVAASDRAEAKRRRKAERELNKGLSTPSWESEGRSASLVQRVAGWLIFVAVIGGLAYLIIVGR